MKTNNKKFAQLVQLHIIECLSEDYNEKENLSASEQLQNVVNEFNNYYSKYEQKMQPNKSEAFRDFLNGLPSVLSVEYTNYAIKETLKEWFEHVGDIYKERKAEQEIDLYFHLIYREFCKMCKTHGVEF